MEKCNGVPPPSSPAFVFASASVFFSFVFFVFFVVVEPLYTVVLLAPILVAHEVELRLHGRIELLLCRLESVSGAGINLPVRLVTAAGATRLVLRSIELRLRVPPAEVPCPLLEALRAQAAARGRQVHQKRVLLLPEGPQGRAVRAPGAPAALVLEEP